MAENCLMVRHPVRLELAINYSVFVYEAWSNPDMARMIARTSFEDAIAEANKGEGDSYKDFMLAMHELRGNLTLCMSGAKGDTPKTGDRLVAFIEGVIQ